MTGEQKKDACEPTPEQAFVDGLVARGQAAKAVDGKLPPGATHEIVGEDEQGHPIVVRRRFSIG
jgi:hypothetical protein